MIAIVPARGGSKGLPGKNIKELLGKPLIGYTIEAGLNSGYIEEVIISTDSREIADVAEAQGGSVPFLRPEELAGDDSKAIDVYIYTIERLKKEYEYDIESFIVLQPTSPLRQTSDIDAAIIKFYDLNADSVIGVTEAQHPPVWAKKITPDGVLEDYFPEFSSNKNRQEIEKAYMPNGALFIFNYSRLKEGYGYCFEKTYPYIMPLERSIDIDTQFDFDLAEFLLSS